MFEKWEIRCKKDFDVKSLKCTEGKIYRIKDKLPSKNQNEIYYEIIGDVGMSQISHEVLCEYFEL